MRCRASAQHVRRGVVINVIDFKTLTAEQIQQSIENAWGKFIDDEHQRSHPKYQEPQKNQYASQFHPSARNLFYHLTSSHELPDVDTNTKTMEELTDLQKQMNELIFAGATRSREPGEE